MVVIDDDIHLRYILILLDLFLSHYSVNMASLLVDFDNIIEPSYLPRLKQRISSSPPSQNHISRGLILVVAQQEYDVLRSLPKGADRIRYLDSDMFVDAISAFTYFLYDKKKRIIEILWKDVPDNALVNLTLESLLSSIPSNVTLWVSVDLDMVDTCAVYIHAGFHNPYISKISPLGTKFDRDKLSLTKLNDIERNDQSASNEVKYVVSQYMTGNCALRAVLSTDTIKYLRNISQRGLTLNSNGSITQKEVAGRLTVSNVRPDLVHELSIVHESLVHGHEEGVEIIEGLYNFHSHPREAYVRHGVQLGWPSAQDYIGFLGSAVVHNTILHIVASIEGFYVLSLSKYWTNHKSQLGNKTVSFVRKNYNFCSKKSRHTPVDYEKIVNNIQYQGFPLFAVQYRLWDEVDKPFDIPFSKLGMNCVTK